MRNLKKILALVLAFVMTMSLVTIASAAEETSANYAEAVEVLNDMGIFKGYEDGEFHGKNLITREEVATILYRIISEDVADAQKGLYVEACDFSDVAATRWSAGFIGYCANGGYVKGYAGKFEPKANVTGYQVLAMALRAIGYDKNGEFTGNDWTKNVAATAQQLGILKNVSKDVVLSEPATRELVAELIFRTIATVAQVTYTPAFGYQPVVSNISKENVTLGFENFELTKGARQTVDKYGRPGYKWSYNLYPYSTTIEEIALAKYNKAVTECTIASDAFYGYTTDVKAWVNGALLGNGTIYRIEAADQLSYVGAQGRQLEVYSDRLVMVDTFLAKVTNVTTVVTDTAGHIINNAKLTLAVYDSDIVDANNNLVPTVYTISRTSNWEYTVGQYLLVNGLTTGANDLFGGHGVIADTATYYAISRTDIVSVAESFTGKQTALHYNLNKHTVEGVTYEDNCTYHKDEAGNDYLSGYTWFKDQFGNIIGSAVIPTTYTYGVINHIQWFTQAANYGYAQATITLIDGTEKTVNVNKLDGVYLERAYAVEGDGARYVSTEWDQNDAFVGQHLYQIVDLGNGYVNMTNVALVKNAAGNFIGFEENGKYVTAGQYNILSNGTVDSNTKFLFGTYPGDEYYFYTTAYTGFNNIVTRTGSKVDYIDVNGDGRIDYVYVLGNNPTAKKAGLFVMTENSQSYTEQLVEDGVVVNCFVLTGYVNGTAGSIKIKNNADGIALVQKIMRDWTANDKNAMFNFISINGKVTHADVITGYFDMKADNDSNYYNWDGNTYSWGTDYKYAQYVNRHEFAYTNDGDNTNDEYAYYDGDVLTLYRGTTIIGQYDVTDATRVIGTLTPYANYGKDYVIHVVAEHYYDENALEIYVFQKAQFAGTGTVTPAVNGLVVDLANTGVVTVANYVNNYLYPVSATKAISVTVLKNNVVTGTLSSYLLANSANTSFSVGTFATNDVVTVLVTIDGVTYSDTVTIA